MMSPRQIRFSGLFSCRRKNRLFSENRAKTVQIPTYVSNNKLSLKQSNIVL